MRNTPIKATAIPTTSIDQLIRDTEQQISHLQSKLEAYRETKESAVSWGWATDPDEVAVQTVNNDRSKKLRPTECVLAILKENPGLAVKQIIEASNGRIETSAANVDRLIYSTLSDLKRREKVKKENGGYSLTNHQATEGSE